MSSSNTAMRSSSFMALMIVAALIYLPNSVLSEGAKCELIMQSIKQERGVGIRLGKPYIEKYWRGILLKECGKDPHGLSERSAESISRYTSCLKGPATLEMNKILNSSEEIKRSAAKTKRLRDSYKANGCVPGP